MMFWGGFDGSYLNSGARYNPETDRWVDTAVSDAPEARAYPTAVWTGNEMIVWGGSNITSGFLDTGGRYAPNADSWVATTTTNAPAGRRFHTAIWTGSEMIVWGGEDSSDPLGTGARYCAAPSGTPTPTPTPSPSPKDSLENISTRLSVGTGDNVLIGGFIVTGTVPEKVLIRAIGPSLADFGITDVLADPVLEVHLPDGTVITDDNWKDTTYTGGDPPFGGNPPSNDLESALVLTLDPVNPNVPGSGAYTAIVKGKDGGTGVALVEAYSLDEGADAQLANISTRGLVQTGDNVMIGGTILGKTSQVLVRAIGPTLAQFGVPNPLENPTLELRNASGDLIFSNDDWKETQQSDITATGLAPSDDHESAILITLDAGAYTAIVRGKDDTSGVALVEAYNIAF
jgi:hypothetical protein